MADIFFSYANEDRETMLKLREYLESAGYSCWSAPDDIKGGETWVEQILNAIDECKAVLILFSLVANDSEHVKTEIAQAFDKGKAIIPVRIEDTKPSGTLEYILRLRQWIDAFPGPIDRHYPKLKESITELVHKAEAGEQPLESTREEIPEGSVTKKRGKKSILIAAASVLAALIVAAGVFFIVRAGSDNKGSTSKTSDTKQQEATAGIDETRTPNKPAGVTASLGISPNPVSGLQQVTITYSITNNSNKQITKEFEAIWVSIGHDYVSGILLADISQDIGIGVTVQNSITVEMTQDVPGDYRLYMTIAQRAGSNSFVNDKIIADIPVTVSGY